MPKSVRSSSVVRPLWGCAFFLIHFGCPWDREFRMAYGSRGCPAEGKSSGSWGQDRGHRGQKNKSFWSFRRTSPTVSTRQSCHRTGMFRQGPAKSSGDGILNFCPVRFLRGSKVQNSTVSGVGMLSIVARVPNIVDTGGTS